MLLSVNYENTSFLLYACLYLFFFSQIICYNLFHYATTTNVTLAMEAMGIINILCPAQLSEIYKTEKPLTGIRFY